VPASPGWKTPAGKTAATRSFPEIDAVPRLVSTDKAVNPPRDFEINDIRSVFVTSRPFVAGPAVDLNDPKFENGIICSAD
jgi:hypothetical protein